MSEEGRVEEAVHDSIYEDVHFWPEELKKEELKDCAVQMLKQYVPAIQRGYTPEIPLTKEKTKRMETAVIISAAMDEGLQKLVANVEEGYNQLVYHNFAHAIDVTQLMFTLLSSPSIELPTEIGNREKFYMLFACLCHDIGHFGLGNREFNDELSTCSFAKQYGRKVCGEACKRTVLENFHVEKTIQIIETHEFFAKDEIAPEVVNALKVWSTSMILATDLSNQEYFLKCINNWKTNPFVPLNHDPVLREVAVPGPLPLLFIKFADMGNVFRDYPCAKAWTKFVLIEMEAAEKVKNTYKGQDTTWEDLLEACRREAEDVEDLVNNRPLDEVEKRMTAFAARFIFPMLLSLRDVHQEAFLFVKNALMEAIPASRKKTSGLYQILTKF